MTTYTPFKSLPKYERGDAPDLSGAYNSAMDILDGELNCASDELTSLDTRVTANEFQLENHTADIGKNRQNIAANANAITELQEEDVRHTAAIQALQRDEIDHVARFESLEAADIRIEAKHDDEMSLANTRIRQCEDLLTAVQVIDQTQSSQISTLIEKDNEHDDEIAGLKEQDEYLQGQIDNSVKLMTTAQVKTTDLINKWVRNFGETYNEMDKRILATETTANSAYEKSTQAMETAKACDENIQPAIEAADYVKKFEENVYPAINEAVQDSLDKGNATWDRIEDVNKRIDQVEENGVSADRVSEAVEQYITENESNLITKDDVQSEIETRVTQEVHDYWDYYSVQFAKVEYVDEKDAEINARIDALSEDSSGLVTKDYFERETQKFLTDEALREAIQGAQMDVTDRLDALEEFDQTVGETYATKADVTDLEDRFTEFQEQGIDKDTVQGAIDDYISEHDGGLATKTDTENLQSQLDALPTKDYVLGALSTYATKQDLAKIGDSVTQNITPKLTELEEKYNAANTKVNELEQRLALLTQQITGFTAALSDYVQKSDTISAEEIQQMLDGTWVAS